MRKFFVLLVRAVLAVIIVFAIVVIGFFLMDTFAVPDTSSIEATKIKNDLCELKSAYILYYGDREEWPEPGEEASLDLYCDRPIVNGSRFAKVAIGKEYYDSSGEPHINIGAELIPDRKKSKVIQEKLAVLAPEWGLLQYENDNQSRYSSGLNVYINLR